MAKFFDLKGSKVLKGLKRGASTGASLARKGYAGLETGVGFARKKAQQFDAYKKEVAKRRVENLKLRNEQLRQSLAEQRELAKLRREQAELRKEQSQGYFPQGNGFDELEALFGKKRKR